MTAWHPPQIIFGTPMRESVAWFGSFFVNNMIAQIGHAKCVDACFPDAGTLCVAHRFVGIFGQLAGFDFAVTRDQAKAVLSSFIDQRLSQFGDYQDAMIQGEAWMFHAHIGLYLNCGLLLPLDCIEAAEEAYHKGKAPLNGVEGFIRQILGWREYVRGIYWLKMPNYADENYFAADRPLPAFYWTGDTEMNCLRQCVLETKANAYAHHIQRLMVLGNFALIAGLSPKDVNEWFMRMPMNGLSSPMFLGWFFLRTGAFWQANPMQQGAVTSTKCPIIVYPAVIKWPRKMVLMPVRSIIYIGIFWRETAINLPQTHAWA